MVEVVPREELLGRGAHQRLCVLLESLILQISPLLIDVLLVKVVFLWRDERCPHAFGHKLVPREVFEPGMALYFFSTTGSAQAVLRLALDHL